MSADLFDLGARLAAAAHHRPMPRLTGSPVAGLYDPIHITATMRKGRVTITAADQHHRAGRSASGAAAVALLADLGVALTGDQPRTLLLSDAITLPLLLTWARRHCDPEQASGTVGAAVAYWSDRADFIGGQAVIDLPTACRARWVLGTGPADEQHMTVWRQWLDAADALAVAELVAAGEPLRFLDAIAADDRYIYQRAATGQQNGQDWRRPDSPARAAIGLKARNDAAALYEAALLSDPLWRRRAVHSGHVVCGVAQPVSGTVGTFTVACDRLDARLRVGTDVTGWAGSPEGAAHVPFRGTVSATTVTGTGTGSVLLLTVTGTRLGAPLPGQRVTLHQADPNPRLMGMGRSRYAGLYATKRSWLTSGRTPTPARRDTPLDVVIAAADCVGAGE